MVLLGLWGLSFARYSTYEKVDKIFQSCLEYHVCHLMGRANKMKEDNKTGKLTEEQREALEASAIDMAKSSAMAILDIDSLPFTEEWMRASAAYHVRVAKMQFIGSGLYQAEVEDELSSLLKKAEEEEDEDEDDE